MKCAQCGYEWKLAGPQRGGRAKVPKGFAINREAQAKAQATRKACRKNPTEKPC